MKILLLSSTNMFSADSTPGDLRMSNLARTWVSCGASVTLLRFCKVGCPQEEVNKLEGVELKLRYVTEKSWKLIMLLERVFARICPFNVQHTVRNFLLWRFVRGFINKTEYDCVITSLPGHGSLFLAQRISRQKKIPLVVDFRDLPDEFDPTHKSWRMKIECWAVRRALRKAALVTVVSPLWPETLKERFGYANAKVAMNGYEGSMPPSSNTVCRTRRMTIFYAGSMAYGRDRNLELIFEALDKLANHGVDISQIEIKIAGDYKPERFTRLNKFKSYPLLAHIGKIPRSEALRYQQEASILLNIASPEAPGVIPSKIFEYAKACRPVLNIPSKTDVLAQFVNMSRIGECCETADEIAKYIDTKLAAWRQFGFVAAPDSDREYLKQFSRAHQATNFYGYLKGIVGK